jgi:hypothetical protein
MDEMSSNSNSGSKTKTPPEEGGVGFSGKLLSLYLQFASDNAS